MSKDTVTRLCQPGEIEDPLTEALRNGARRLLAQTVEAEVDAMLAEHAELKTDDGRQRLVRHGHGPERDILTGIGPVPVKRPKVRDRGATGEERIRFTSSILPRFARRSPSVDAVLPVLYLRGVSSGDFQEALGALLGKNAPSVSPQALARLKAEWKADYERWRARDLNGRHYVYLWADGVYLQGRLEDEKQCLLVVIGATPEGRKKLVGFQTGFRESAQSWRELLEDLRGRGLTIAPDPEPFPLSRGQLRSPLRSAPAGAVAQAMQRHRQAGATPWAARRGDRRRFLRRPVGVSPPLRWITPRRAAFLARSPEKPSQ